MTDIRLTRLLAASAAAHALALSLWNVLPPPPMHYTGNGPTLTLTLNPAATPPSPRPGLPNGTAASDQAPTRHGSPVTHEQQIGPTPEALAAGTTGPSPVPEGTHQAPRSSSTEGAPDTPLYREAEAWVRKELALYLDYPESARRRGWQGRVRLGVHVAPDGRLSNVRLVGSSGHQVLDRAALRGLSRVAALPPQRRWQPRAHLEMILPVEYRLTDG